MRAAKKFMKAIPLSLEKIPHFVRDDKPAKRHSESFGSAQDKLHEESFFSKPGSDSK